jgi:hypothetical protein
MHPAISVVIPSNHNPSNLLKVVKAICLQTVKPTEIIIVDSYIGAKECSMGIVEICAENGLELIYVHFESALPGHARNIGLGISNAQLVAFIDVQTIPHPNWLEVSLDLIAGDEVMGVWGATHFYAETSFERLVRDSFYGPLPRKTLPGSIFRRTAFTKTGLMIDWVRAGEDTEWMMRLELLKLQISSPNKALIEYVGLTGLNLQSLLKKWYRNYLAADNLPHFYSQKLLLWLVMYPLLILIAFNWNYLIADWRMDSPLYIGHITKLAAILPPTAYVLARGIIIPFQHGVSFCNLFPFRFIAISGLCLLADSIKALVFTIPKAKN